VTAPVRFAGELSTDLSTYTSSVILTAYAYIILFLVITKNIKALSTGISYILCFVSVVFHTCNIVKTPILHRPSDRFSDLMYKYYNNRFEFKMNSVHLMIDLIQPSFL